MDDSQAWEGVSNHEFDNQAFRMQPLRGKYRVQLRLDSPKYAKTGTTLLRLPRCVLSYLFSSRLSVHVVNCCFVLLSRSLQFRAAPGDKRVQKTLTCPVVWLIAMRSSTAQTLQ